MTQRWREATTAADKPARRAHATLRDVRAAPLRHLHRIFPHARTAEISERTPTCYLLTNRMIDSWTRHRTLSWTIAAFRNAPPPRATDTLPGPQIYLRLTLSPMRLTSELIFWLYPRVHQIWRRSRDHARDIIWKQMKHPETFELLSAWSVVKFMDFKEIWFGNRIIR